MKKGIVVLLIAVLVAGFAFAGLTGYAEVDFGVDFDSADWGFTNLKYGKYSFSFELDTAAASVGAEHTTDVWAELEASATAYLALTGYYMDDTFAGGASYYELEISKANIHVGEDLTIGILSAGSVVDFASAYSKKTFSYKTDYAYYKNGTAVDAKKTNKYSLAYNLIGGSAYVYNASEAAPGIEVTFKDWYGGFGAEGNWESETYTIFAHIATPEFKFAEDAVTVQAGAYGVLNDSDSLAGGGAKVAYEAEKVSADAGVDVLYNDETFMFEAAANAKLNFVEHLPITLNVYATPGKLFDALGWAAKGYDDELKLDAKLSVGYTLNVNEDIAVDLSAYVNATDVLLEDAREIQVYAGEETTIDAFTVELSQSYKIMAKTLALTFDVTYAAEKFEAYASLETDFDFSADEALDEIPFECGISSEAIVEGAELALVYADADFADFENAKGNVTVSCKISF